MLGGLYCGLSTLLKRIRSSGPHLFVVLPSILCPKFSFLKVQYPVCSMKPLVLKGTGCVTLFNFATLVLLVYTKFLSDDRGRGWRNGHTTLFTATETTPHPVRLHQPLTRFIFCISWGERWGYNMLVHFQKCSQNTVRTHVPRTLY